MTSIVEVQNIGKIFGTSVALEGVNLQIAPGECLGLVGHNGAGKSTLMNIISGIFPATSGTFLVGGREQGAGYDVHTANDLGIRTIFQELSLCPSLTVVENMRVFHPEFSGVGWRGRAAKAIISTLDAIFPGHGIRTRDRVETLTLGKRQTLEIAKACAGVRHGLNLLILDEPTSALDYHTAKQLLDHINRGKGGSTAYVYISHMLDEVLEVADRILVLKDGKISGELKREEASRDRLIELMGGSHEPAGQHARGRAGAAVGEKELIRAKRGDPAERIALRAGEVIGLAGLAGHGQTDLLVDLFDRKTNRDYDILGPETFIPGDRPRDGIFPLWSIVRNLTVQVYHRVRKYRLIDLRLEENVSGRWRESMRIRTPNMNDNILSLSGGNQQKVLFARCLESDAEIVLMDDPTRGVDFGTKEIIYRLIGEESARGRGFVWYTTEMDELKYCDRVYVFRDGRIVAEMPGSEATEEAILRSSF